jgi:hypothetical protein
MGGAARKWLGRVYLELNSGLWAGGGSIGRSG